jgi:AmpE protein
MSLLVLLIALGLRHFGLARGMAAILCAWSRGWVHGWEARGSREGWAGVLTLTLIVGLPTLLVAVLASMASGVWHVLLLGMVSLAVMVTVLLDQQQPDVLRRETEAWRAADEKAALLIVQAAPGDIERAAAEEFQRARQALLAEQLREIFAPVFWFLLLGPAAAVAYHFLRLTAARDNIAATQAGRLLHYAEWPVARALALSFALAGDFLATWQHWRAHVLDAGMEALSLLDESAVRSQRVELVMRPDVMPGEMLCSALQAIAALLQRALVLWVVLLALHTLWQ